jgi:hypothetical protein
MTFTIILLYMAQSYIISVSDVVKLTIIEEYVNSVIAFCNGGEC